MNVQIQKGSAQKLLLDYLENTKQTQSILLYIFITLVIVFKDQIPPSIYVQSDSLLGRIFIVVSVYFVTSYYGWILGLLYAIAYALLLGLPNQLSSTVKEGFGSGGESSLQVVPTAKKWLVEKILHENPIAIEEEKVVTSAVQNDNRSGYASSGNVQNSNVT